MEPILRCPIEFLAYFVEKQKDSFTRSGLKFEKIP